MELPEKDRQALIEAARRRGQGGAAFGVYPSSGKRPEKLNVSRDVNMPAQVARGWVAGTLGLPGDIEGLGRMLINMAPAGQEHERVTGRSFVSETPVLPTSDFYKEWLPGGDDRPAAQFASGLGALAGGAGATRVAGAAVKGAKATGKALGPKAAEMAEGYLQKSGLAPTVVKPKGGNWLSGSVEGGTQPLKRGVVDEAAVRRLMGDAFADERLADPIDNAINDWIDTKLNKYIRNEMATPEDPVRKLAERGVLHFNAPAVEATASLDEKRRAFAQANDNKWGYGQSQLAQNWEDASDKMVNTLTAGKIAEMNPDMVKRNWSGLDWVYKADPETMIYGLNRGSGSPTDPSIDSLGFDHLIDELRNATRADSDLPANLRWKPEDLKKVTMEQAVERVAKINDWRAAQMAAAQKAAREGIPLHKEYEGGFQWMAAPDTAIDPKSLQYIKDVGCEGGWCTQGEDAARRYGGGGNQLYVLHEPSGKPVVQISVKPGKPWNERSGVFHNNPELEDSWRQFAIEASSAEKGNRPTNYIVRYPEWLSKNHPDLYQKYAHVFEKDPPEIVEIKGKQNRAPKEEHLPMVQDFVRSGRWSRVGDIQNTGMRAASSVFNDAELQRLRDAGETNIPYILSGEDIQRLHNLITPEGRRLKYDAKGNIVGSEEAGYAKGGLVQDTDAIAAKLTGMDKDKALTHALRMANAKQEAHMAAGGLAKLLKGAKKAEEATKAAKATEKAAEAAKPAVKGPQAEALETARKNAVKMLGLPENNTAMDRARAMGFDTEAYKGMHPYDPNTGEIWGVRNGRFVPVENIGAEPEVIRSIDPTRTSKMELGGRHAGFFGGKDIANAFAGYTSKNSAVFPVLLNMGKNPEIFEGAGKYAGAFQFERPAGMNNNLDEYKRFQRAFFSDSPSSGAVIKDTVDEGTIFIPRAGNQVRSRFAAFDPARVNENDLLGAADPALLAGTAVASGIGLGALGQAKKRKPEQPEQKKAAGGLAALVKGSKAAKAAPAAKPAQIGNYQALPLQLPRAPNLPPQELTKTAERVARQQMGEHVRKVPNKSENLAGRSMKEVERLKNLDIQLKPTKQIPTPTVVPEKVGEVRMGLPGDISISDQILMSVNNLPIGAQQEGGALYGFGKMDLPDPAFWASNRVPAQQVQNKATDVANVFNTPDVLAMHLAMGHEAMNFAQHFADANLRAIQQMRVNPESAKLFNEIVRAGNPKTGEKFPHFPGVENYEETYKALQQDPEMRKWFNNRMKVDKITGPLGLPSGKEIEYAVMEPSLSNMEPSMVGLSVGRLRPGAELIPGSAHKTYSHDIPGLALGRTQELLPVDLAFPDAAAHIRKTKRPDDFTATIQKLYPHQIVDQQYIDQVGEYYNRLRQIRGYKKGGAVKKSGLSVLNKAII